MKQKQKRAKREKSSNEEPLPVDIKENFENIQISVNSDPNPLEEFLAKPNYKPSYQQFEFDNKQLSDTPINSRTIQHFINTLEFEQKYVNSQFEQENEFTKIMNEKIQNTIAEISKYQQSKDQENKEYEKALLSDYQQKKKNEIIKYCQLLDKKIQIAEQYLAGNFDQQLGLAEFEMSQSNIIKSEDLNQILDQIVKNNAFAINKDNEELKKLFKDTFQMVKKAKQEEQQMQELLENYEQILFNKLQSQIEEVPFEILLNQELYQSVNI